VKIRLVNEMDSDHPMHHPFHVHGAGRFLVVARDGEVEQNLVWKDHRARAYRRGGRHPARRHEPWAVDGALHIAEHHESGMMFSFDVDERAGGPEGRWGA
jgi:FtsP/CotA-like multicopper oxidase with cupredoxin domain